MKSPPHGRDRSPKLSYLTRAREVAAGLRGVDPHHEAAFDEAAARVEAALSGEG